MRKILFKFSCCLFLLCVWITCRKPQESTPVFRFETPAHFGNKFQIPADNPITEQGFELGRMLFYDKRLSLTNKVACASCHVQENGFAEPKKVSVGILGRVGKRNSMHLANLLWSEKFFWDGRANSLEEQALLALESPTEMGIQPIEAAKKLQNIPEYPPLFQKAFGTSQITPDLIAKALAQFERMLISANSKYDKIVKREVQPTPRERRAIELFFTHPIPEINLRGGNCGDCHGSHLTTLNTFHDNGLDLIYKDLGLGAVTGLPSDNGKMKTPSLRNVALTAPYMHDGRFQTLREVLDHYNEHIQNSPNLDPLIIAASNEIRGTSLKLTEQEKQDIILFLEMLTDYDFIKNKKFSNPFK
ncbi:MAG: cytochrome-c peroxidase [Microscillaceae bacterium]|nr:cytochrome-c peroxidase [Microscillaceae bacterium]MDW8460951.1 cytochrome c peroxidase [Cytophagales bacterium]